MDINGKKVREREREVCVCVCEREREREVRWTYYHLFLYRYKHAHQQWVTVLQLVLLMVLEHLASDKVYTNYYIPLNIKSIQYYITLYTKLYMIYVLQMTPQEINSGTLSVIYYMIPLMNRSVVIILNLSSLIQVHSRYESSYQ